MTVVIAGKLNTCNFLFTDAFSYRGNKVNSYKECKLVNKINRIHSGNCYATLCGMDYMLKAIEIIDYWAYIKRKKLDFFNSDEYVSESIEVSKILQKVYPQKDSSLKLNQLYLMNRSAIRKLSIVDNSDFTKPYTSDFFDENYIEINYSGDAFRDNFIKDENEIFKQCIEYIEKLHEERKEKEKGLSYDFNGRYCCVILAKDTKKRTEYFPYKNLTDILSNDMLLMNTIENPDFIWSPEW